MARRFHLDPSKTYKTEADAQKAVEKLSLPGNCRYFITLDAQGRFFPVFVGSEGMQYGVHFHFPVIG